MDCGISRIRDGKRARSTSPGERLWANVRRVVGVSSEPSEPGASEPSSEDVSDEALDVSDDASSSGASPDKPDERDPRPIRDESLDADEDAWSEDDEADLLAAVADMLGLDVSDPMPEERATTRGEWDARGGADAPATTLLGSRPAGAVGREAQAHADAMFAGAEATESVPTENEEVSAFEVDAHVAQARATNEGHER